jgi:uncharacterized membrane protein YhaH (DUF805 family)
MSWYVKALKRYAEFGGRSQRSEFWMFTLVNLIINIAFTAAAAGLGPESGGGKMVSMLSTIYSLGVLIPSYAVAIRRMHDTNRSGWWILLPIVNIVFWCQDSDPGTNRFGPNPKAMMGR